MLLFYNLDQNNIFERCLDLGKSVMNSIIFAIISLGKLSHVFIRPHFSSLGQKEN